LAAVCAAASPVAGARIGVSIVPMASGQRGASHSAVLGVDNRSGQAVRAVAVRMIEGGPTFLLPLAVPPDSNAALAVQLPVYAAEQVYAVRSLAGETADAAKLAEAIVLTSWPAESVGANDFIDYDAYRQNVLLPVSARPPARELFTAATLAAIALCAALFIRRPAWRIGAAGAIVLASTAGILLWVQTNAQTVRAHTISAPSADANLPTETMLAVSCLRTTRWQRPSARLVPVYVGQRQMLDDDAVVDPRAGLTVTIRAGETRVFRMPGD